MIIQIMCSQSSTLNHTAPGYLHQPVVGSHFENSLLLHLNCLLLEEVVGTCQDSQSCQEDLHCHLSECAGTGFHFLLGGIFLILLQQE